MHLKYFSLLLLLGCFGIGSAQVTNKRQQELEVQRQRLQKEIKQINQLLYSNIKKKKTALSEAEDLDLKLNKRKSLIRVNNAQVNVLTQQINVNQRNIDLQRNELKILKEDYAKMIQSAYLSKSAENRLLFLFSSENFLQAYKRIQYLKQYADFRKKQGEAIASKTVLLQELNKSLIAQKTQKEGLISENKKVQEILSKELRTQQIMIRSLRKKEKSLASQIEAKEKKAAAINREIDRLIKEAIAASNRAAGKSGSSVFSLTPEAKLIAENFVANKGRLPWPLEKGLVVQGFGRQPHPIVKTTMIQSNGVTIATTPNAKVRAVFEGEVMSIILIKGSNVSVLIRHGNYITVYKNLGKVYVKKGDKIAAKQEIGEVFTNRQTNKTTLQFCVFADKAPQNPKGWIYGM